MCRLRVLSSITLPILALVASHLVGCPGSSQQGPERLPTVPVRGTVLVNDLPAPGVIVKFHRIGEPDGTAEIYAAKPKAVTGGDGEFEMSTYLDGDGVVAGEYRVTFEWRKFDRLKNGYSGPDQLGNKYSDPEQSEFVASVTGNEQPGVTLEPFKLKK